MIRADIPIELTIAGPFITKPSAPGQWGLDACLARDGDGIPYIADTHIVGKLREAWEEMASALKRTAAGSPLVPDARTIDDLLGAEAEDARPKSKRLLFSDFRLQGSPGNAGVRYRIRIDAERGAVVGRAQLLVESPFASDEELHFCGKICFLASDKNETERVGEQVRCGLQWVDQMGAFRSLGFGRLTNVEVGTVETTAPTNAAAITEACDSLDLVIKPEAPFCVDATGPAENLYYSSEIIPGGVILGCLAAMLGLGNKKSREIYASNTPSRLPNA